jgi:threonine/homoserine/homoserine lactone efflux protein
MDMLNFIPAPSILATYSVACFILFATPGPDMSLFLSRTMAGGRRAGIASMLGASLGTLIHTALAAVGLSALIAASPTAFLVIKIAGALYLAWLAVDAIRYGSALYVRSEGGREMPVTRVFWLGVMVNLSNP